MLKRRLILAAAIVAAGVFASFYGGAARIVFRMTLLIPLISLLYTLYVYARFRIYQVAENKIIVKGEKTPYFFALSNEDCISYVDIKVLFLDDLSIPQDMELSRSYHIIPAEKLEERTEILCKYRGEYNIGVKSVIITDFLGLMRIKYPAPSTINMSVLPKITSLEKVNLAPLDTDAKLLRFLRGNSSEPPDCEVRKYVNGDSIKRVNWKLSAKKRELFIRQDSDVQNSGIVIVMDMSIKDYDEYERVVSEDKIIESALSLADFLVRKNVPLTIVYEQGAVHSEYITNPESLKEFYGKSAAMKFNAEHSVAQIYSSKSRLSSRGGFIIFAVRTMTQALCNVCNNIIKLDGDVAVLLVGNDGEKYSQSLDRRVIYKQIALSDEIEDILGGCDES